MCSTKSPASETPGTTGRPVYLQLVTGRTRPFRFISLGRGAGEDELFENQDALRAMGAEAAWKRIDPNQINKIVTAIVDSGVELDHPGLAGRLVPGRDFPCLTQACNGGEPDLPHGTAMAGIVAAGRGNGGTIGVAWNTRVMPLRISGNNGATAEDAAVEAIQHASSKGAKVINFSYASNQPTDDIRNQLLNAEEDFLIVVPAGDQGLGGQIYPASYSIDRMIVVTGHDSGGHPEGGIGVGAKIDIAAPTEAIYPVPRDPVTNTFGHGIDSSTSNATAYVSGAAALLWSLHPDWTAAKIKKHILDTAVREPKLDPVMIKGRRLDLDKMTAP